MLEGQQHVLSELKAYNGNHLLAGHVLSVIEDQQYCCCFRAGHVLSALEGQHGAISQQEQTGIHPLILPYLLIEIPNGHCIFIILVRISHITVP